MGFLDGKKALISGVASNRSIAFGVAKCLHREGAELAFTYQTEKLKPRVEKIASDDTGESLNAKPIQNFWFINTEDRQDINLVDTQVKYDKNYTYNIYSYTINVGLKYKVDERFMEAQYSS